MATLALLVAIAMSAASCEREPKPVSHWTVEDARRFNEFPVYWLGESYEGLPLTSMPRIVDADGVLHVEFNYGEPYYSGDSLSGSWHSPLEIGIQPYCGYSPEEFLSNDEYWDEDWNAEPVEVRIRGVSGQLQRYSSSNSSLFLWTGDASIHLSISKSKLDIEEVARDLFPIADSIATAIDALPAPRVGSCLQPATSDHQ